MPRLYLALSLSLAALMPAAPQVLSQPQAAPGPNAPVVAPVVAPMVIRVEPPNWWIGLTPELMLLISGHNLEATHVLCNLNTVHVSRTQATAGGDYLFVWLKISPEARSGTAVCHIATPTGETSFELPLANRQLTFGKFQGLAPQDAIYLLVPDRFADGDPTNDEPKIPPNSQPAVAQQAPISLQSNDAANGISGKSAGYGAAKTFDRSNPRAYHGGDLRGIRDHLAYLQDLGVTALSLTPIVKNGVTEDYHSYGAVDLYSVDPHLGTLDDYRQLVAEAHQRKMKIFFDVVSNHVGPRHPWVQNPPLPDWFHGALQQHLSTSAATEASFYGHAASPSTSTPKANDPIETLVDPHAPVSLSRNLTDGWLLGILPDMNTENPVVAQYLLQNAIWWTETSGLDGFCVGTLPYAPRKFWSEWSAGLHAIYPYLTTIGEVVHPNPEVESFFVGGARRWDGIDSGITTVFDFPMSFALRDILQHDASAGKIPDVLRQDALYPHPENLVVFFQNHDHPRLSSGEYTSLTKLKLAYGLVLTLRGIPEIYYGDEIALPGGERGEVGDGGERGERGESRSGPDDNRRDFPGGWIGDPENAFLSSGRTAQQQEMFSYAQSLLHLRREHVALQTGRLWHVFSDPTAYVFLRDTEEEHLLVAFNNSAAPRTVRIHVRDTPLQRLPAATSLFGEGTADIFGGELRLALPAQSISVFNLY